LREKETEKNNRARLFLHSVKEPRPFLIPIPTGSEWTTIKFLLPSIDDANEEIFFKIIFDDVELFRERQEIGVADTKLPILTRDSVSKCGPVKMRINGVEPGAML
jgi:hypothetical protein